MGMSLSQFGSSEPQQRPFPSEWRQKLGSSKRSHANMEDSSSQHNGSNGGHGGYEDNLPMSKDPDGTISHHVLGAAIPIDSSAGRKLHHDTLGPSFEEFVDYTLWGS